MRAAVLTRYGDVDALELREVDEPRPKPGEVKLRITASSLNAIDLKLMSGALKDWFPLKLPAILGFDASGVVTELGGGVSSLAIGDQVFGQVRHGEAEVATAPAAALARVPERLPLVDAAAIPVVGLTGAQLIEEAVRPKPGARVLVTGAVGSVGRVAVHVARTLGVRVIAGVRARQLQEARALEVEDVVALDDAAAVERLPVLDGIADTVGGETVVRLFPKLAPGGVLGSVLGEPPGAKERGITVVAISAHPDAPRLVALAEEVVRGSLVLPIAGRFPLSQIREAFRRAQQGGGKVLVTAGLPA
ncbi:MAG TPA: NADP-dependent oxidoreductase [Myxococcaceae bacterium]|nr:NADP-dependent oxidoreductase [Myxococcaceae bacterium]